MKFLFSEVVSKSTSIFVPNDIYAVIYKKLFSQEVLPELRKIQNRFKLKSETRNLSCSFYDQYFGKEPWRIVDKNVYFVNKNQFGPLSKLQTEKYNLSIPTWWEDGYTLIHNVWF